MTFIQCDCQKFKAELIRFPKDTPGRLVCYCDDCQKFLQKIGREDILDEFGGTEIIPVYPANFKIVEGSEYLQCNKLYRKGLHRWTVTCCNTPIANTKPGFPWVGIQHKAYTNADPEVLNKLGKIRSRIQGKFKKGNPPFQVSETLKFKDAIIVLPFVIKGILLKKVKPSPFFKEDGVTPISEPVLLN